MRLVEPPLMQSLLAERKPFVLAHWHGDELVLLPLLRRYRTATMISTSQDGELMNTVVHYLGGKTSRGSSTRGGVSALKGLLKLIRNGHNPSIAVDGPKGPYHKAKPGVFEISRIVDAPIFVAGTACNHAFVFKKSWNKAFLPLPFAEVHVVWQPGLPAVARSDDPRAPELAHTLESKLDAAGQQAVQLLIARGYLQC